MATTSHRAPSPGRVVSLEGPSASGKTTLATALADAAGALVVPELDASGAPPIAESAAWFVDRSAARWQGAAALAVDGARLVVLDGDPFKGLWYNAVYAEHGWPGVDTLAPLYRAHVARGTLAFPDLYVLLGATETQLRERRVGDASRARRNFETHLRLVEPQRRHFAALADAAPERVLVLDTTARHSLAAEVLAAVERLPPGRPDSVRLLDHLLAVAGVRSA